MGIRLGQGLFWAAIAIEQRVGRLWGAMREMNPVTVYLTASQLLYTCTNLPQGNPLCESFGHTFRPGPTILVASCDLEYLNRDGVT